MSPQPRNEPIPVEQWSSYQYWTESDERRAQHWYISLCLMMSSAQDWLTGVALKEAGNLNWSATASYYSTVHCGRLLCFVACGDFPMSHSKLRGLFANSAAPQQQRRQFGNRDAPPHDIAGYPFDWLRKFVAGIYGGGEISSSDANGKTIGRALRTLAPTLTPELDELCPRFASLGALRNDSNYESLLIAHEFNHRLVSDLFQRLADNAVHLAERAARLSRDVFLAYVERDERIEAHRPAFRAATAAYFDRRVTPAIQSKVSFSPTAEAALQQFVDVPSLAALRDDNHADWDDIENQISMELFDSKTSLMRAFEDKVYALAGPATERLLFPQ